MARERRVVAGTVADMLGISEERARALLAPDGPLAEHVLERTNPHYRSGPPMRVVPLSVVLEWVDRHGDVLERWQAQREKNLARRSRSAARQASGEDAGEDA